jgi:hypothetical protein
MVFNCASLAMLQISSHVKQTGYNGQAEFMAMQSKLAFFIEIVGIWMSVVEEGLVD